MQVGGHVGTLLGADPLGTFGTQVVDQSQRPRPDHDGETDHAEQTRDEHR